ncbi:MAG TPA: TIGR00159 family protein [Caldilineae bacterium]|nr:TIGR00159 family protein [Caldilineae bacterium]
MDELTAILSQFDWPRSFIDIALVTLVFYGILRLFAGTQGVQLLRGVLVIILVGALAANFSGLTAFTWLIRSGGVAILIALPVIFQPELRRALERLGRTGRLFSRTRDSTLTSKLISELVSTCTRLSRLRMGAIIVLEDQTGLRELTETGVRIDAAVNTELLLTIFHPGTPLHDGAVIIRDDRIVAASCVLPLTQRPLSDTSLGTRHRAAIGVTEDTDALSLVVSEETGSISAARNGRLARRLDERRLRRVLESFYESRGQLFGAQGPEGEGEEGESE